MSALYSLHQMEASKAMAPATPARQRRRFGRINKLRSGRYQAGYIAPDGRVVYAEQTFPTKTAADRWLMLVESELSRDTWTPPERRRETVAEWSDRWLGSRTRLAERTVELYRWLLDRHILSVLGDIALGDLSGDDVLEWYQSLASTHRTTAAKAYRLLSSIMRAAVDDGVLARSPCRLAGAGREDAPTRPTATVVEVDRLATAMPEHMQIVVLLAAWCQLRRGEILGLQRLDVDLDHEVLTVERTRTPTMRSGVVVGGPKTEAGRRSVAIPPHVAVALAGHLERFVSPERTAWVAVGKPGTSTRHGSVTGLSQRRSRTSQYWITLSAIVMRTRWWRVAGGGWRHESPSPGSLLERVTRNDFAFSAREAASGGD